MNAKTPQDSEVTMTELVLPQHTNARGTVFGGVVMSWTDIAAAVCALRHANHAVVTASIDALHFLAPIKLGWIVTIKARINQTWNSSMEVGVKIEAENPLTREHNHTASAYITFVALNSNDKPIKIPSIIAETDLDRRRQKDAVLRRENRLALKQRLTEKN